MGSEENSSEQIAKSQVIKGIRRALEQKAKGESHAPDSRLGFGQAPETPEGHEAPEAPETRSAMAAEQSTAAELPSAPAETDKVEQPSEPTKTSELSEPEPAPATPVAPSRPGVPVPATPPAPPAPKRVSEPQEAPESESETVGQVDATGTKEHAFKKQLSSLKQSFQEYKEKVHQKSEEAKNAPIHELQEAETAYDRTHAADTAEEGTAASAVAADAPQAASPAADVADSTTEAPIAPTSASTTKPAGLMAAAAKAYDQQAAQAHKSANEIDSETVVATVSGTANSTSKEPTSAEDEPVDQAQITRWILLSILVVLSLVGLVWGIKTLASPIQRVFNMDDDGAQPVATATQETVEGAKPKDQPAPAPAEKPAAPIEITNLEQKSPDGVGKDHPELLGKITDGNGDSTWRSRYFNQPTFRSGGSIQILITLKAPAKVGAVKITSPAQGGKIEIAQPGGDPWAAQKSLANGTFGPETVIKFDPITTDKLLVQIPELPRDKEGKNRAWISSITLMP
ncbi:hypothetical protein BSR29_00085 [Boudabousia liubingyangii]|uniref:F5/8 type C domain-containing protein n=1 Tax=Boudabousia liubingyangii TaxID=1921764 RepID=A0A1Q5PP94_9ACTO|nr:hypothetical protein [Boudabousia liubingyangii]OKL49411.1 hypothetical protein BSR29_00085 [Boudabousia liubingyangii]